MLRLLLPLTCDFVVPEVARGPDPCLFRRGLILQLVILGAAAQRDPVKHPVNY